VLRAGLGVVLGTRVDGSVVLRARLGVVLGTRVDGSVVLRVGVNVVLRIRLNSHFHPQIGRRALPPWQPFAPKW
jgi:hypothetical protein